LYNHGNSKLKQKEHLCKGFQDINRKLSSRLWISSEILGNNFSCYTSPFSETRCYIIRYLFYLSLEAACSTETLVYFVTEGCLHWLYTGCFGKNSRYFRRW